MNAPEWMQQEAAEIDKIINMYPRKQSALMPLFYLAQEKNGHVSDEDLGAIAERCGVTKAYAESVISFYSLYHREPVGKYVITICNNIACGLEGADNLRRHLEQTLGVKAGETTPDGLITLQTTGECVAACDAAPALQVNLEYCNKVDPERADAIVEAIRKGDSPEAIADQFGGLSLQKTAGFTKTAG